MSAQFSFKQKLGALLLDAPRYWWHLWRAKLGDRSAWQKIKNREQKLSLEQSGNGVRCEWQWTSDLHLPKLFPSFGTKIYQQAIAQYPIEFRQSPPDSTALPNVSFVIGHRGMERAALLIKTIESIFAQKNCSVECIVVEQDTQQRIEQILPNGVKYLFKPLADDDALYNRAMAFNLGAAHANSDCLIFHDNDMPVPTCYAAETFKYFQQGYDFINLKRFIFYFSQKQTARLLSGHLDQCPHLESIMQNALGGGSIGAARAAFNSIGKFDERFIGWGGEDNEFWQRAITRKVWQYANLPLLHLWHPAQAGKSQNTNGTFKLYQQLSELPVEQRIADLNAGATSHSQE